MWDVPWAHDFTSARRKGYSRSCLHNTRALPWTQNNAAQRHHRQSALRRLLRAWAAAAATQHAATLDAENRAQEQWFAACGARALWGWREAAALQVVQKAALHRVMVMLLESEAKVQLL